MDFYRDYLQKLRKLNLAQPCFVIKSDIAPQLCYYVKLLYEIRYTDGSYHTYYGELKKVISSYMLNWTDVMDDATKEADRLIHTATRDDLLENVQNTVQLHRQKQIDFGKLLLPVQTPRERQAYEEIETLFDHFMVEMQRLKETIEHLKKKEDIDEFSKEYFPLALKQKNDMFLFTYEYISLGISKCVDRIKVSIEEIYNRVRSNLRCMEENSSMSLSNLFDQLYDKNKEHLKISRQEIRSSLEIAEVQRSMEIIKDKIEDSKHVPTERLKEECLYWQQRIHDLDVIYYRIKKLKALQAQLTKEESDYMTFLQYPDMKYEVPAEFSDSDKQKCERLYKLKLDAAKCLCTFFTVKGLDRKMYKDQIGPYFIDEYGHQVYVSNYGLSIHHVNCIGESFQPSDNELYYYDYKGRYVEKDGEKIYQVAPCSSSYILKNDLRYKVTDDCGHSSQPNKNCKMVVKNPFDVVKHHETELFDIKKTLKPETVEYLWNVFGHILPLALNDVALTQPKNPIHYFAHKILYHKYRHTLEELEDMKQESWKYRYEIVQKRKDDAIAASKKWRDKLVTRRKPEESDETSERSVLAAHVAQLEFIRYLDSYNT